MDLNNGIEARVVDCRCWGLGQVVRCVSAVMNLQSVQGVS